ncbi:hypothetical protein PAGL106935_16930 [Paenibacillus glucanolyticus]
MSEWEQTDRHEGVSLAGLYYVTVEEPTPFKQELELYLG